MAIYMKYASIDGDVTTEGYSKYIELNSVQWGVGRGVAMQSGSGEGRESSLPSLSEVTVTKDYDVSSPDLLKEGLSGGAKDVDIVFTRTNKSGSGVDKYLEVKLKDVIMSGLSMSSGGDKPSESLSLNYSSISFVSIPMKDDGTQGTQSVVNFDLKTMKMS
ncbi:type VI secretion system tube protein Hcp [Acidiphilium sp. AL]|uniref:Type VI secretion system tube protein Hcp n=1 Tax=Acidiphilium iwatense TaxID=768198 RepID=A0ABS9E0R4_9PROT|nr:MULTISPECIES: type VI secretion system tube protein Hcp [Acidiphilium]MCF3947620.1 type VI secretion system tube protein Hcp [Acidiphilium iwatense]MCU4160786.1 type VI secretion system tube protein Hcp [Acidiphilium sp. AL]